MAKKKEVKKEPVKAPVKAKTKAPVQPKVKVSKAEKPKKKNVKPRVFYLVLNQKETDGRSCCVKINARDMAHANEYAASKYPHLAEHLTDQKPDNISEPLEVDA